MDTKKRLLTLAAALSISLTACEGFPTEPTLGLETGEAGLSLAAFHGTVTIAFDDVPPPKGDELVTFVETHKEAGFTLVHSGKDFMSPWTTNPIYVGSKTLIPFVDDGVTSLTKDGEDGGGVFDVVSIDLAEAPSFRGLGVTSVKFTGTKADESASVTQTFMTDGDFGLQTFTFDTSLFTDLVSLSWTQDFFFPHQFDNIVLSFHSYDPLPSDSDPVTRDDCKKGGFADFDFRNQGECVRFVEKNKNGKDKPQERPARES